MSDWKVIGKRDAIVRNLITDVLTCGLTAAAGHRDSVYTLEHKDTGEIRTITTEDNYTLGQRIADGDFND